MKKYLLLILNLFFAFALNAQPYFIWAKNFGGKGWGEAFSIAVDKYDNAYSTGSFNDTVDFDPGPGVYNLISQSGAPTIFISKLNKHGNFLWAKQIGGNLSAEQAFSIAIDGLNNIYITGYFEGTVDFDPGAGIFNLTAMVN